MILTRHSMATMILSGLAALIALSAAFVAGAGATATPADGATTAKLKGCDPATPRGSTRPARLIRVSGVSCAVGQNVARAVVPEAPKGCVKHVANHEVRFSKPCTRLGYRCTARLIVSRHIVDATCKRGTSRRVMFQY